jgi:hypothetical protein
MYSPRKDEAPTPNRCSQTIVRWYTAAMPRLIAALAVSVLAASCWLPLYGKFSSAVPSYYPDVYEFLWNFWLFKHHPTDVLGQRTELLFAPYGGSLLLHTGVPGLVIPLVTLLPELTGPAMFNVSVLALTAMNFLSAVWCFRRIGAAWEVVTLGAGIVTFHPFFLGHLQAGHLNFLCFGPVLLMIGRAATMHRRVTLGEGLLLSLGLAWSAVTNLYYFYFSILVAVFFAAAHVITHRRNAIHALSGFALTVLAGIVLAAPAIHPVWKARQSGAFTGDHDPNKHSADISQIFLPGPGQVSSLVVDDWVSRPSTLFGMHETSVFVPWGLLLFIGILSVRRRVAWRDSLPFLIFALLCGILACGPVFAVLGEPIFRNVVFEVARVLPAFPSVPARFGILASVFLICGVIVIGRREIGLLFPTLLLAAIEIFPKPPRVLDIASSPVLDRLAESSLKRVVDADGVSNMVLGAQIFHGRPVVGGFLSRRPRKVESEYRRNPFLAALWRDRSSEDGAIWGGFVQLNADGVLVRRSLSRQSSLMSGLPCFTLIDEDASFHLYIPSNGALCVR